MDFKNGWLVLGLLAVMLTLSYAFAYVQMHNAIPLMATQVAGNQELVGQLNKAFEQQGKALESRFAKIEARLETLEKR